MNDILLSIIVPVYNVAKYLPKCLDSLLNQDIDKEEYEIILVDDGSLDRCGEICDEYAAKYDNIKVVHRENGGLSAARNSGIEIAQGKYIQFVDSDDYLEPNVEKALVEKMEMENLDILRFNYQNVNDNYEVFDPNKSGKLYVDYRDGICDGLAFLNERLGYACYAWQFVLKAELVRSIPLFKEGIYFEDTEWTPRILVVAKRVTSVSIVVYNYLIRRGSITKSVEPAKRQKLFGDSLALIDAKKVQMQKVSDRRWFEGIIAHLVVSAISNLSKDFYPQRKKYLDILKGKKVYPLSTYHLTPSAARKVKLINFSPALACWLLHLKNGR